MAVDVSTGCVKLSAKMTQAWDHGTLLSLTKKADNGRASVGRGDGEYQLPAAQIPAARDAVMQQPLWPVHVELEVKPEWWFSHITVTRYS